MGTAADALGPVGQISTAGFADDVQVEIVATPDSYVVLSVRRAGDAIWAQRLTLADALPIDADATSVAHFASRLGGLYTDQIVLAARDAGADTTTIGVLTYPSNSPVFTPRSSAFEAVAESGLVPTTLGIAMFTSAAAGYSEWSVPFDGSTASKGGGSGTGDTSSMCAVARTPTFATIVCPKVTTQPMCVRGYYDIATRFGPAGAFNEACPAPSIANVGTSTYLVYENGGGVHIAAWDNASFVQPPFITTITTSGSHPFITTDARGLWIAYRTGSVLLVTGIDRTTFAVTTPPYVVSGLPTVRGMSAIPFGDHTFLLVATADGMYRVRI